jgi:hypothetical protein
MVHDELVSDELGIGELVNGELTSDEPLVGEHVVGIDYAVIEVASMLTMVEVQVDTLVCAFLVVRTSAHDAAHFWVPRLDVSEEPVGSSEVQVGGAFHRHETVLVNAVESRNLLEGSMMKDAVTVSCLWVLLDSSMIVVVIEVVEGVLVVVVHGEWMAAVASMESDILTLDYPLKLQEEEVVLVAVAFECYNLDMTVMERLVHFVSRP